MSTSSNNYVGLRSGIPKNKVDQNFQIISKFPNLFVWFGLVWFGLVGGGRKVTKVKSLNANAFAKLDEQGGNIRHH